MTVLLWRIASDAPTWQATDLTGEGARITGGRWNSKGRAVVYSSGSIALACLETVVHLAGGLPLPLNRALVRLEVPDGLWNARETWPAEGAPDGWADEPPGRVSIDVGDAWLASGRTALAQVPSAIVPEESNVLVNPAHPGVSAIVATRIRPWRYDTRLRPMVEPASGPPK